MVGIKKRTFGATIREARLKKKLTLRGVARVLGVSHVYLLAVERSERRPLAPGYLSTVAELLDLDRAELDRLVAIEAGLRYPVAKMAAIEERVAACDRIIAKLRGAS
jgi:transcriptional regulator with XRE-family HTH domain